jgi:recombinational DNA repair ATPase RecF
VKPDVKKISNKYTKALKQRNRALKNKRDNSEIDIWTKEVSSIGLDLSLLQYDFFKHFKTYSKKYIEDITSVDSFNFLEGLDVSFSKGWERSKKLDESLDDCIERDKGIGLYL